MKESLSIGRLSAHTGVAGSALRYYEALGIISEPDRSGGKRRYTREAVEAVEAVKR